MKPYATFILPSISSSKTVAHKYSTKQPYDYVFILHSMVWFLHSITFKEMENTIAAFNTLVHKQIRVHMIITINLIAILT